uniref:Uncharacterized protein n=1 Tax=Cacopsylla melanoneura TaxID=428564 RepID=A0A8D8R1C3_9HEMI
MYNHQFTSIAFLFLSLFLVRSVYTLKSSNSLNSLKEQPAHENYEKSPEEAMKMQEIVSEPAQETNLNTNGMNGIEATPEPEKVTKRYYPAWTKRRKYMRSRKMKAYWRRQKEAGHTERLVESRKRMLEFHRKMREEGKTEMFKEHSAFMKQYWKKEKESKKHVRLDKQRELMIRYHQMRKQQRQQAV